MREQYVEAVLAVAGLIPAGRVLSYGDIAALLESGGPRQVGAVMSAHGSAVPWWRVIRANGSAPVCHEGRALSHYLEEATALHGVTASETQATTAASAAAAARAAGKAPGQSSRAPSWRVDMKTARWNPSEPEFDLIDAIAARLQNADDGGTSGSADGARAPDDDAAATGMSVLRDGLEA